MTPDKDLFHSPTKGEMNVDKVISEISDFISEDPGKFYRVVIGSDSQSKRVNPAPRRGARMNSHAEIDFVTAVVVHRTGKGARYFWKKQKLIKSPALREKIYSETLMSLETAEKMVPLLRSAISPAKYDFEIHIDVGPLGPTRDMIKEVVGMVQGNGYVAKTKPDSWGASSVADKHT